MCGCVCEESSACSGATRKASGTSVERMEITSRTAEIHPEEQCNNRMWTDRLRAQNISSFYRSGVTVSQGYYLYEQCLCCGMGQQIPACALALIGHTGPEHNDTITEGQPIHIGKRL